MNLVDVVILVILAVGTFQGLRRGFIVEVAAILGTVIALAVARAEYRPVLHVLKSTFHQSPWLTAISYLIVFLAVMGGIMILARILRRLARLAFLGPFDRLGGAVLGLILAVLLLDLFLYLGTRLPNPALQEAIKRSTLTPAFLSFAPYIHHWFPHMAG